jgi:hypothetical protein
MDFDDADEVDGRVFNRILWKGMMGDKPFPSVPSGKDLRLNRDKLLAQFWRSRQPKVMSPSRPAGE